MATEASRDETRSPGWTDPREEISFGVLLPSGRLAGRSFRDEAEARAWVREEDGEQVVSFMPLCDCEM